MKKALYLLALVFCLFPYTQIIQLESYTQPYALLFSIAASVVAVPLVQRAFPRNDLLMLVALALSGVLAFVATTMPRPDAQEFKYLLIYLSPLFFAVATFAVTIEDPRLTDRVILVAALAWMVTGVIQAVIDPSFMTQLIGEFGEAGSVTAASGRGSLGFAPEPTHFGFHLVILAALLTIVGGRNLLAVACLATAILVARSSSALLALVLGSLVYLLVFGRWGRVLLLATIPAFFIIGEIVQSGLLPSDIRLVGLLRGFYADPWYLITSDASANARLGGIWVGMKEIAANAFLPAGLSSGAWEARVGPILASNPWLINLSSAGIPSGSLIIVYQLGVVGLAIMAYLHVRMLRGLQSHLETFLMCAVAFVFMSQYMVSTPGFGMIIGVVAARRVLAQKGDPRQWHRPIPPPPLAAPAALPA